MNAKEELTKLLMESYDRGVEDAKQAAIESLAQVVAIEREACAKACEDDPSKAGEWPVDAPTGGYYAEIIRARGNT